MRSNGKANPELTRKILNRLVDRPLLQADDQIDFHFMMRELNTYQILRLLELSLNVQIRHFEEEPSPEN